MKVNGSEIEYAGKCLAAIVHELGFSDKSVAVAVNNDVIRREDWIKIVPQEMDEIIIFEGCEGG